MKNFSVLFFLCSIVFALSAQSNTPSVSIKIIPTDTPIQVNGKLEEAIWQQVPKVSDFWKQAPVDNQKAESSTEVQMVYDDRFIYLAATIWDDPAYIIQTLKRDNYGESDAFAVIIDPVNEQTNGYAFAVNAKGAQSELLVAPSGSGFSANNTDESWDNKWLVAVENSVDHWTVEMAIPFKTLRFKTDLTQWGINFIRLDPGLNETHVWSPVPRQFDEFDLGYLGQLEWEKAPQNEGKNISFIPYTRVANNQNSLEDSKATDIAVGADAKIALSPTLNLDLTYNPDFSQVEVDRQVTNLTRFNIFFPERRQFFLENADIFTEYGQYADRPFYSRRIGLDASGNPIPIQYGVRLSGNINAKSRLGIINMHTKSEIGRFGQNYSTVTFQQRLWKRSTIKGIFLNRQAYEGSEQVEQQFRTFLTIQNLGENYFADLGFNGRLNNFNPETNEFIRIGYTQIGNMLNYYIYPEDSEKVNFHWSGIENFVYINNGGRLNEWYTRFRHFIFFKNTSQLRFRLNNNYVDLLFPFALTATPFPVDSYNMTEFNVQFNTDLRKRLNTEMFIVYGEFYNGNKLTYRGSVSYRIQPWGNFTLGLERNDIWLPAEYGKVDFTLATASVDINFATNLFWTTFLQYNSLDRRLVLLY